jgi:xylulokinase
VQTITPNPDLRAFYDTLFDRYVRLYESSKDVIHELAADQRGA